MVLTFECPPPSLEEIHAVVQQLPNNKSAGGDDIYSEMIKHGGQPAIAWLHRVIAAVWQEGCAPEEWRQSIIVPIFKKGDAAICDNYRATACRAWLAKCTPKCF